jgi:3-hydroxybutyryl-CoA dehydrogenase
MKKVTVIGAGTMGHGIAQVSALAGYDTILCDESTSAVQGGLARIKKNFEGAVARKKLTSIEVEAVLERLSISSDTLGAAANADLIIEAIVEDLDIKGALFEGLNEAAPAKAIFATNTSSLSVGQIAQASGRPGKVVGMHFFNPVHIMKLVEIVTHDALDADVVETIREVSGKMRKEPIVVSDSPGFASSRLGVVLGLEAMRMVEQGVASADDIDTALQLGYGHPMGPLRVTDLVGLDVRLAIAEYLHRELKEPHYEPPAILRDKVANGELGKKSGKGFYEWPTTS